MQTMETKELPAPSLFVAQTDLALRGATGNTERVYRQSISRFMTYCDQRGLNPLELSLDDAWDYRDHLATQMQPSSVRTALSGVRTLYKLMHMTGAVAINVWPVVKSPNARQGMRKSHALRDEDMVRQLASLSTPRPRKQGGGRCAPPGRDILIYLLMVEAGLRVGEVLTLGRECVSYGRQGASLAVVGKGNKPRNILITDGLAARIAEQQTHAQPGGTLLGLSAQSGYVRKLWRNLLGTNPHALRHTHITLAAEAGVPERDIAATVGHSDTKTTLHYIDQRVHKSSARVVKVPS